ncbi:MAG: DUF131 domain-containing protein [Candidatus Hydrothermarchaeota archaeon]|nr:DUF131 domain-containing protein [Candidatus Hydrothermarchaeota archaeon]
MKGYDIFTIGVVLIFLGVLLVIMGAFTSGFKAKDAEVRGGGVVLIGPFPIILGSDPQAAKTVIILAIILIIVAFLFFTRWTR